MSDLVERLRGEVPNDRDACCLEAADEIERLRAENERLREALERLVNDCEGYPAYERPCYAVDMARAALAGGDKS